MNIKDRLNRAYQTPSKKGDENGKGRDSAAPEGEGSGRSGARRQGEGPSTSRDRGKPDPGARRPARPDARAAAAAHAREPEIAEGLLKSGLPGIQKAAKFLLLLGSEEAASVIRHLKPDEIEKVSREIAAIDRIDTVEANQILAEFGWLVKTRGGSVEGGFGTAEKMLVAAFGEERARDVLRKAVPGDSRPFQFLSVYDAKGISTLLKDESPQVLSVVLPYLDPKLAGEVIVNLPNAARSEVVKRIARLEKVDPEVLLRMEEGFREKIRKIGSVEVEEVDGRSALAAILRHVDTSMEESLLDHIGEDNPELSDDIRERLFTVDDILRVEDRDMQKALKGMDERAVAMIMKGKSQAFRDKLLENVSQNRRIIIKEEYDILGAVRRDESERATREFMEIFKRKLDAGELNLHGDDELVD
ncbi:MAG: flagellar motor switch protein FliG [Spirochaetes bacterium]|nr:flagellar motor switch protein FliG [Spirochaetota bacterium]